MWIAATVSYIGSFVQDVNERWLILELTKSALPSAMLATAFVTASLVMMLPSGVLADRFDRRALVIASQLVQAAPAAVIAIVSWTGHVTPGILLAGATIMGFGMALGAPAWTAIIPEILPREHVPDAIGLSAISFNVARAVGPAIGGLVLSELGAPMGFALNAVSFLVVVIVVMRVDLPKTRPKETTSLRGAFAEPFAVARRDEGVRASMIAMLFFTLGAAMVYALAPAYGKQTLHASARAYGFMIGAMGAGAILGVYVLARVRAHLPPRLLLGALMMLYAICALALSQIHDVRLATLVFVPAGIGWTGSFSSLSALVQLWTSERLRARIIALYSMLHLGMWAIGATLGGSIADAKSVRAAMFVGACLCALTSLITSRLPLPASFLGPPGSIPPPAPETVVP